MIDFSDIFMTDFAQLDLGMLDRSRSSWTKVKGFPHNMELELEATFSGGGRRSFMSHSDGVADHRGITVVIHYSLMKTPDSGYQPRTADDRVGHFLSATKDFGVTDADSNFVRMINRWRLEKANPRAKLSPPKKQIVWYVEDTVPIEYRPYVEEGIREWNKAFEKIGFKDAIAVRWEESRPRRCSTPRTRITARSAGSPTTWRGAMSCLRASPLTGEMIDGDVVFDAGFIRYWKQQYALLVGSTTAAGGQAAGSAARHRRGDQPDPGREDGLRPAAGPCAARDRGTRQEPESDGPRGRSRQSEPTRLGAGQELRAGTRGFCQFQTGFQHDFGLAAIALADTKGPEKPAGDKDKDKAAPRSHSPRTSCPRSSWARRSSTS